jgi:hypothetical protein
MCDPITAALVVAGTAFSMYGDTKVAGAQKRDIAKAGKDYEAERARQKEYQAQNAGTVADTLRSYSGPAMADRTAAATDRRGKLYKAPIEGMSFQTDAPKDFDPNSAVAGANRARGLTEKLRALSLAGSKAALDSYGDVQQGASIYSANNANKIGMVSRIAGASANAEKVNQGVLPLKMQADQGAGATYRTIGDALKLAAAVSGMGGGFGVSEAGVPTQSTSWLVRQGAPSWMTGYYAPSAAGPSFPGFPGVPG